VSYILDTNVATEAAKSPPDPNCEAWLKANRGECFLSSITLAELRYGIGRRTDGKEKSRLEKEFQLLIRDCSGQFYDFDAASASEWGRYAAVLEGGYGTGWWQKFDLRDTLIAAIAREYGLTVATRNSMHFPYCQTVIHSIPKT
jgi:predicted nucleic acid-binding protein